jgi:predicted alpha-1,2-mannosidase
LALSAQFKLPGENMNKRIIVIILTFIFLVTKTGAQDLTKYVDPFIGTGGHGHTYPGATAPFGMVQVSPDTRTGNWDACGGYHYSDKTIIGFSHLHISGTGCLDYGDILFMPTSGKIQLQAGDEKNSLTGYRSKFNHSSEVAEPGYYSVMLSDDTINTELTATTRAAFHRYSYHKSSSGNLIIDLTHQLERKELIKELEFCVIANNKIEGMRRSQGWAPDQIIYFVAEFSKSISEYGIEHDGKIYKDVKTLSGNDLKAYLKFEIGNNDPLLVKVGFSSVDYEGARKNLEAEIPGWEFDKIRNETKTLWNKELSKIIIKDSSEEKKKIFYTALYHATIVPNTFFDVDRRYRGNDHQIHTCNNFDNYTVFSLWDTFRAAHPLYILIEPARVSNMIKSLLSKYDESGMLPKWELAGNETDCMIGYHAVPVITDAYVKGIRDFDSNKALKAMVNSAYNSNPEMKLYMQLGYIPADKKNESVSKTLEYSYDDWAIYTMAKALGDDKIKNEFQGRAKYYANLFDGASGFFRGKSYNGNWVSEFDFDGNIIPKFDPLQTSRNYTEGNAWQYSVLVPHDINGLVSLYGTKEKFINHVDKLFSTQLPSSKISGEDVSGLIGQYAHGNEPSHHIAYLYNFIGQPWKTQARIHRIYKEMYTAGPDGLAGNEDCGQMSSWFNFSSMGFYPFCPGTDEYQIGTPYFDEVTIKLDNGKTFVVKAINIGDRSYYIHSAKLNGKDLLVPFIRHADIINGGELVFTMGSKPNKNWGVVKEVKPYSLTEEKSVSTPYIKNDFGLLIGKKKIDIGCATEGAEIRYTLDGSSPDKNSALYKGSFILEMNTNLKFAAYKAGFNPSQIISLKSEIEKAADIPESSLVNGVTYKYYEGLFRSAYDIQKEKVKKLGTLNYFSLEPAEVKDLFGFSFDAYLFVPAEDVYSFYTKSDDGSILLIDNKEIVNNDGGHSATKAKSNIIALAKGYHQITLLYFDKYEDNIVEVGWGSKKIKKQIIPAEFLFRKK